MKAKFQMAKRFLKERKCGHVYKSNKGHQASKAWWDNKNKK